MRLAPFLTLLLLPLAACSEDSVEAAKSAAGKTIDGVAGAANKVADNVRDIDLSALSAAELRKKASWVLNWSADQLEKVRTSEGAEKAARAVDQVLDAAGGLLEKAADQLPEKQQLRARIEDVRQRHAGDSQVMQALDPVLERLSRLLE